MAVSGTSQTEQYNSFLLAHSGHSLSKGRNTVYRFENGMPKFQRTGARCARALTLVFNRIDVDRGTYSRCDASGCDEYDAVLRSSGIFTLIEVPGRDILAKMSHDGSLFLEVVTLVTDVYVSFGSCSWEE